MRKIRDFIYDYNDVFVAMIIVVAAAVIILWRMSGIMNYNEYLASHGEDKPGLDISFTEEDLTPEDVDPIEDVGDDPSEGGDLPSPEPQPQPEPDTDPQPEPEPEPDIKYFSIEISAKNKNANWTAVGNALEENGIVPSRREFVARVVERKVDGKLHTGTFEFNSSMTLDEVIDIIVK